VTLNICTYYSSSGVQLAIKKMWQSRWSILQLTSHIQSFNQHHAVPPRLLLCLRTVSPTTLLESKTGGSTCGWWRLCSWTAPAALRLDDQGGAASGRRRRRCNVQVARRVDGGGRSVSTPTRCSNGVGAAASSRNPDQYLVTLSP
jgi:hypothetical protein